MTRPTTLQGVIVFSLHASAVDTTHSPYAANTDSTTPAISARMPHTHQKHIVEDIMVLAPLRQHHIIDVKASLGHSWGINRLSPYRGPVQAELTGATQQQEKEQSEIADPRQDSSCAAFAKLCVVYFVWCLCTGVFHN